jgi:hypothetical protein
MLVDNLLPELKLKQSNILTMGDFNFDCPGSHVGFPICTKIIDQV